MKSVTFFKKWFPGKSKEEPNTTESTAVIVGLQKPLPPLPLKIAVKKGGRPLLPLDADRGGSPLQVSRGPGDMYPLRSSPAPPPYQKNPFLFGPSGRSEG